MDGEESEFNFVCSVPDSLICSVFLHGEGATADRVLW